MECCGRRRRVLRQLMDDSASGKLLMFCFPIPQKRGDAVTPGAELAAPTLVPSPRARVFPGRAVDRELVRQRGGSRERGAKDRAEEGLGVIAACCLPLATATTFPLLGWTFTLSLVKH